MFKERYFSTPPTFGLCQMQHVAPVKVNGDASLKVVG